MNEKAWLEIIGWGVQLVCAGLGVLGALKALRDYFASEVEKVKIKAKESSAGETAVKEINERLATIDRQIKEQGDRSDNQYNQMLKHLKDSTTDMLSAVLKRPTK